MAVGDELLGEFQRVAHASVQRLARLARDADSPPYARPVAVLAACLALPVAYLPVRRGAYVAALNRSKSALEAYNGAPANAESLRIMAKAYEELGMSDLAADTRRILALNFPGEG